MTPPPRSARMFGALGIGVALATAAFAKASQPESGAHSIPKAPLAATQAPARIDATVFFQQLVDRYRLLARYKDTIRLVHITSRDGKESNRVETLITCEIDEAGELRVQTPGSQLRQSIGTKLPAKKPASSDGESKSTKTSSTTPATSAQKQYDLWLAPHMSLKYADQPLKQLRAGVDEGFTATEANAVTIDNKPMVHVNLKSGDGLSENCEAEFDLYVNPESMLVERIEGRQTLPDGAECETTLQITPQETEDAQTGANARPALG